MSATYQFQRGMRFKRPIDATSCEECMFYSSLLKYCMKYKVPIEDPASPPCKPKGYFIYKRPDPNTLIGELCIHDFKKLSTVIPLKPNVRIGEILDGLEKVGCKAIASKRVGDTVKLTLKCPCMVRVELRCDEKRCMYKILPK